MNADLSAAARDLFFSGNYFKSDSEKFAVAAGVEIDSLNPPASPTPEDAGPGDV